MIAPALLSASVRAASIGASRGVGYDRHAAEDAAQTALLEAIEYGFLDQPSLVATCARRRAIDKGRAQATEIRVRHDRPSQPSPSQVAEGRELAAEIEAAINCLSPGKRRCLVQSLWPGSWPEHCKTLGVSAGTFSSSISRARTELRERLQLG